MSANTKGIESSTTNVLEAVQKQLSGGDNKGAMESLHAALEQRIPIWVKNHEKIAIQFFDLAVACFAFLSHCASGNTGLSEAGHGLS